MKLAIVYWRDIPAQVMAGQGRSATRVAMSDRFQEAIDRAATRAGLIGSDAYTAEWRREQVEGDDPHRMALQLESEITPAVLEDLIKNWGKR